MLSAYQTEKEIRNAYREMENMISNPPPSLSATQSLTRQLQMLKDEGYIEDFSGIEEKDGLLHYSYQRLTPVKRITDVSHINGFNFTKTRTPRKLKKKLTSGASGRREA